MGYDERLQTAERCAQLLRELVRPMYSGPTGDQGLNDPTYMKIRNALRAYDAARDRPETS